MKRKILKRVSCLIVALAMMTALAACKTTTTPTSTDQGESVELTVMGNSDVPVGRYTQKILTYYKLDESALAKAGSITYGSNVKEVTTQVSEGSVDCGVVYCTDAYSAGLTVVATATAEMCGRAIYPAGRDESQRKQGCREGVSHLPSDG